MLTLTHILNRIKLVFFVGLDGLDTHTNQNVRLVPLLTEFYTALSSFQAAINSMGKADRVITLPVMVMARPMGQSKWVLQVLNATRCDLISVTLL